MSLFKKIVDFFKGKKQQPQKQGKWSGKRSQRDGAAKQGERRGKGNGQRPQRQPRGEVPSRSSRFERADARKNTRRSFKDQPAQKKNGHGLRKPAARETTLANPAPADSGDWTLDQFQVPPEEGKMRFHDFDLPVEIMHAVSDLGFKYCTPIQAGSLEKALNGVNVAGRAQTGTGKTAAYLVAILTRYLRTPDRRQSALGTPRAVVIAPTRELCVQVCRDAQALGKYCNLRSYAVFGGVDQARQREEIAAGPIDLLAATPGRLLDFQRQRVLDLSHVDTLVIDEADRMLDMGFIPDVRKIIYHLPKERQTLLYSATLNDDVMRLASQWMPNPVKVEIDPESTAASTIVQKMYIASSDEKFTILCNLLDQVQGKRCLVFANRRTTTESLAEKLRRFGHPCELLSGDVQQSHRMRVIEDFRSGKTLTVVATDVAGRGLHIAEIALVVNFELPYEAEDYIHRIGRTGRAGSVGTAVSFADEDESFVIPDIEKLMGEPLKCSMPEEELLKPVQRRRPPRADKPADAPNGGAVSSIKQPSAPADAPAPTPANADAPSAPKPDRREPRKPSPPRKAPVLRTQTWTPGE